MEKFAAMGKVELRAACKAAGISYSKLDNAGMRAALEANEMTAAEALNADIADARSEAPVDLASLGEWGVGTDEASAACPHCGTHHPSNGVLRPDDEAMVRNGAFSTSSNKTLWETGEQHAEFACMGCGGEWGPVRAPYVKPASKPDAHTGTGLKIEKVREERNGVKRPSIGGKCRAVWDALDQLQAELEAGEVVTSKMVKDLATDEGWNANNASIEFYQWRKFNGVTGRSK